MNRSTLFAVSILSGLLLVQVSCARAQPQPATSNAAKPAQPSAAGLRTGTDWPIFLGPQETGISTETGLLKKWPESGPPLVWQARVGTGYSAPSVMGHQLVLHHRIGDEEIVTCVQAHNGEAIWAYRYPSNFSDPYGYNNGPRCSPLLTKDKCYTLGAEGKLTCLQLSDGKLLWQRDLLKDFVIPEGFFGVGSTPALEGDKLIVCVGGQPNSGVVAFDASTGKTLWENVGKSTWDQAETGWSSDPVHTWSDEDMVVSYSSPIVATIHDQRHLLCLMRHGLVSLDPQTGQENFHYWFRSRTHESVNAARPVVVGDTIMLSAAYRVGSAQIKVKPDGKSYDVTWSDPRNLLTHWSTAIAHDGHYFGFSGRHENEGELRCIDASNGEVKWSTTGWDQPTTTLKQRADGAIVDTATEQEIPFPFYGRGSAILVDGQFIVLAERGTLALVNARSDKWEEVSRCKAPLMHYPSWTAPVLSRGYLYLRCEDAIVCLDLKAPGK